MISHRTLIATLPLWGLLGCDGDDTARRILDPGVIVLELSADGQRRPVVEFNHGKHAAALEAEGCKACHPTDARGRLSRRFKRLGEQPGELMHLYHRECIGCHTRRAKQGKPTGVVTCGECHAPRGQTPRMTQVAMRFDYSLHGRHVQSLGQKESCAACHHVLDPRTRKLVPGKGKEEGCGACHGEADRGKVLSSRHAAHASCIGCHLKLTGEGKKAGPVRCVRCHDAAMQRSVARLPVVPRLDRGQPPVKVIAAPGTLAGPVVFNHLGHEAVAPFCSTCHHQGLRSCVECHSHVGPAAKGGAVNLERAYHDPQSMRSCVGCHSRKTAQRDCTGCHTQITDPAVREHTCRVCHVSKPAGASQPASLPATPPSVPELAPLPVASDDLPERVTIKTLAHDYKPSTFPHRKIVARLDAAIRNSKLARSFHGQVGAMCSGCHHRSPPGATRPPSCAACHSAWSGGASLESGAERATRGGARARAGQDRPDLKAAYHRQCLGCHEKMGLKTDCTTCHEKAEVER